MSPIYMIGGEQGDGKSFFSMALLDYLTNHGTDCLLIDSDISNPDVYAIYSKAVSSTILDLSVPDGWVELVNLCESNWGKTIVINGTANGIDGIERYSKTLLNCLFALQRHLVTFWVTSDDTRTLDNLDRYKKVVGRRIVHIIRNAKYYPRNSFLLNEQHPRYQELRRNGRFMYLPVLDEEEHEYFTEAGVTIGQCIEDLKINSPSSSGLQKMLDWRLDAADYVFKEADFRIGDIINTDGKSYYQTFTRRLADQIEEKLVDSRRETFQSYDFYSPPDRQFNDWDNEDIGDLLAEGKVSIEDLAAVAASGRDLKIEDFLRLERAIEPETEEECQERLQKEYRQGSNPSDFIVSASDIHWRSLTEYLQGGNPKNFIPTSEEIRERAVNDYHKGCPPKGFVPTQNEIDGIYEILF
jgi:hypothetical protein